MQISGGVLCFFLYIWLFCRTFAPIFAYPLSDILPKPIGNTLEKMMQNTEIERKFLVTNTSYRTQATHHYDIVQGYLCKDKDRTIRVRIRDGRAFLTVKSATNRTGIARFEWEKEIDVADAHQLLELCLPGIIEKTRYVVPAENGLKWEVDEFHGRLDGLTLAELELPSEDFAYTKADFAGEEVTGDAKYYNANM